MEQREEVLRVLGSLDIKYELLEHPAVNTIEDMDELGITSKGTVGKNLFLRNASGKKHYLILMRADKHADLRSLAAKIGSSRLSFASPERLLKYLGLSQGEVSPLGIINDAGREVELFIDRDLSGLSRIGVHPNDNTATLFLSFDGLMAFIKSRGNACKLLSLP